VPALTGLVTSVWLPRPTSAVDDAAPVVRVSLRGPRPSPPVPALALALVQVVAWVPPSPRLRAPQPVPLAAAVLAVPEPVE